jgi:DNA-binding transcriptional MerR regulator
MAERIITLFGEEIVPEQVIAPVKVRTKKKKEDHKTGENAETGTANEETETEDKNAAMPVKSRKKKKKEEENAGESQETDGGDSNEKPAIKIKEREEKKEDFVLPEEWKGDKKYYTIGEVAELFKVKTSHIRFWTNEFNIKVRTTRKGDRLYEPEKIRELKAIYHLVKERGFTLSGAKAKLKSQNKLDVETIDLKSELLELRKKLVIIRDNMV